MNSIRFFCGLYLAIVCLFSTHLNNKTQYVSLANIKSSMNKKMAQITIFDCKKAVNDYLNYLELKNRFMFRVRVTGKYKDLVDSETNKDLLGSYERKYESSVRKLSEIAKEVDSKLEEARTLFETLLECLRKFGEEYSPNSIFEQNKDALKYLSSVDAIAR